MIKQLIGGALIAVIVTVYVLWIRFTMRRTGEHAKQEDGAQTFDVIVKGVYAPAVLEVEVGKPVRIRFRREESTECSRYVNFPDLSVREELPEGKSVTVEFTPEKEGEMLFTCDMSMYQGKVIVK